MSITHISALPDMNGNGELRARADKHDVHILIPSAWPGAMRCDSCGRIVVRGCGRWWERRVWS